MNCPNCGAEYQVVFSGQASGKVKRVSTMSEALHLGRGTVANAYDVLREQGVLERERGSGSVATVPPHLSCSDPLECVRAFFADPGDAVIADR